MARVKVLVDKRAEKQLSRGGFRDELDRLLKYLAAGLMERYGQYIVSLSAFDIEYIDIADLQGKILKGEGKPFLLFAPELTFVLPDNIHHVKLLTEPRFEPNAEAQVIAVLSKEGGSTLVVSDLDDTALGREKSLRLRETNLNPAWLAFMNAHVAENENCHFLQMTSRNEEVLTLDRAQFLQAYRQQHNPGVVFGDYTKEEMEIAAAENAAIRATTVMRDIRSKLPSLFSDTAPLIVFTNGICKWIAIRDRILELRAEERPTCIVLMDDQKLELYPNPYSPAACLAKAELKGDLGITLISLRMQQSFEMIRLNFGAVADFVGENYRPPAVPAMFRQPQEERVDTSDLLCKEDLAGLFSSSSAPKKRKVEDHEDDDGDLVAVKGSAETAERDSKIRKVGGDAPDSAGDAEIVSTLLRIRGNGLS